MQQGEILAAFSMYAMICSRQHSTHVESVALIQRKQETQEAAHV